VILGAAGYKALYEAATNDTECASDETFDYVLGACTKSMATIGSESGTTCPPGQFPNGPGGACVSNFCELGYQPAPGGGCEPVKSDTATPSKPPATSGGGGGYKAPATPATAPPPPVESSFPWKWALAGLLAVGAVGVVVAKKKGYLKNAEDDEDC